MTPPGESLLVVRTMLPTVVMFVVVLAITQAPPPPEF
jgi:hypothetical protein